MKNIYKHARGTGQGEHTLCGVAFDAHQSGDYDYPVVFAGTGELVNCSECRHVIDYIRNGFTKDYRQK